MNSRRQFLKSATAAAGAAALFGPRRLAAAPAARRPNILLVFPDQFRPDWTEFNARVPVRTPNIRALAEAGLRFSHAYCPSPLCAPSRACLAQGLEYARAGVSGNDRNCPDGIVTFYQQLREAGYQVGSIGKADLRKAALDWGVDGLHRVEERVYFREWGFTHGFDSEGKGDVLNGIRRGRNAGLKDPELRNPYSRMLAQRNDGSLETYRGWFVEAYNKTKHKEGTYTYTEPYALPEDAYNDNWVGANALALLKEFGASPKPWFLQVNFPGPHDPLDILPAMAAWYRETDFPQPVANTEFPPETHQRVRRNYSAMVENIDRWLGRLVQAVKAMGADENTLIVFSSDHGEMLGDHNRWAKQVPYDPAASVPLIVRGPGVTRGATCSQVTATLDLPATFLDLAGVPRPSKMDSRSLRAVLAGDFSAGRSHVTSALGNWRMVRSGKYKLVRGFNPDADASVEHPEDLLFDLEADPGEQNNLAAAQQLIVEKLEKLLPPARAAATA